MIIRIQNNNDEKKDAFEMTALKITGTPLYILVIGLVTTSIINIWTGLRPAATVWGIIISIISILVMWFLVLGKRNVGIKFKSNTCRCKLNNGLYLYVRNIINKQCSI